MTTHSSILAWENPWTEEPGGLPSMGSQRVRNDLTTKQRTFGLGLNYTLSFSSKNIHVCVYVCMHIHVDVFVYVFAHACLYRHVKTAD